MMQFSLFAVRACCCIMNHLIIVCSVGILLNYEPLKYDIRPYVQSFFVTKLWEPV